MSIEFKYGNEKFTCPHCKVVSTQKWKISNTISKNMIDVYQHIFLDYRKNIDSYDQTCIQKFLKNTSQDFYEIFKNILPHSFALCICDSCSNFSLWVNKEMVYPKNIPIDSPNSDMNQDIQDLYNEATLILIDSPKGAAALLRLALQKLLWQIGETERNIDKNIKSLVAKGLNPKIQKALDFVRVVGNEAVHPGEINLDDNKEIAISLFKILNLIAHDMITIPKEMDDLYENIIPEEKKQQINTRDGK